MPSSINMIGGRTASSTNRAKTFLVAFPQFDPSTERKHSPKMAVKVLDNKTLTNQKHKQLQSLNRMFRAQQRLQQAEQRHVSSFNSTQSSRRRFRAARASLPSDLIAYYDQATIPGIVKCHKLQNINTPAHLRWIENGQETSATYEEGYTMVMNQLIKPVDQQSASVNIIPFLHQQPLIKDQVQTETKQETSQAGHEDQQIKLIRNLITKMLISLDRLHSEVHMSLLGIDIDKILVGTLDEQPGEELPFFNDLSRSHGLKELQQLDKHQIKDLFEDLKVNQKSRIFLPPEFNTINDSFNSLQGDKVDIYQLGVLLLLLIRSVALGTPCLKSALPFGSASPYDPVYGLLYKGAEAQMESFFALQIAQLKHLGRDTSILEDKNLQLLITQMIQPNPKKRPSALDILDSSSPLSVWLMNNNPNQDPNN